MGLREGWKTWLGVCGAPPWGQELFAFSVGALGRVWQLYMSHAWG